MPRKTLNVNDVRLSVNSALSHPTLAAGIAARSDVTTMEEAVRAGIASVIEHVLHTSGQYNGFRYLDGWPAAREKRTEYRRAYL